MTNEEREAIDTIKGSVGMRALEYMMQRKINDLDSVSKLGGNPSEIGTEALGKKYAVDILREFLADINFLTSKDTLINKTYE